MRNILTTAGISLSVLALAACNNEVEDEAVEGDMAVAVTDEEFLPQGGELNEVQQAGYDAMDRRATSDEYDANRDAMTREAEAMSASGGNDMASDDSDMSSESNGNMAASASDSSNYKAIPARSAMDFEWLDRNDDGMLSVAEYAIWALPTNPNAPEPNDQKPPYLTSEEINEAGQTFFYFDQDGDSYLSESEFASARNSSRTS